jgi:Family of unknown function (DUF6084)
MPDLDFQVFNVEPAAKGLTPLLHFKLRISNGSSDERIYGVVLNAQIQLQPARRTYSAAEKEKLVELFGEPKRWGETVRNRLWAHTNTTVGAFTGYTETILQVPCTFDLNIASAKYFYALEGGDVSLLFLFSGSIFYVTLQGRLQVEPISWNKECAYRMPLRFWKELMETHYPNSAWLTLRSDVFERLYAYKRDNGLASWEQVIEQLLPEEVPA